MARSAQEARLVSLPRTRSFLVERVSITSGHIGFARGSKARFLQRHTIRPRAPVVLRDIPGRDIPIDLIIFPRESIAFIINCDCHVGLSGEEIFLRCIFIGKVVSIVLYRVANTPAKLARKRRDVYEP